MDRLRLDDLERARQTPPAEKARQALELMRLGIEMQRRKLRAMDAAATDDVIERRLLDWMSEPR